VSNSRPIITISGNTYYINGGKISIYQEDGCLKVQHRDRINRIENGIQISEKFGDIPPIEIKHDIGQPNIAIEVKGFCNYLIVTPRGIIGAGQTRRVKIPEFDSFCLEFMDKNRNIKDDLKIQISSENVEDTVPEDNEKRIMQRPYENSVRVKTEDSDTQKLHQTRKDMIRVLENIEEVDKIGKGGYRTVYYDKNDKLEFLEESDGNVIKIGRHSRGVLANRREAQAWQAVSGSEIESYFCPVTNIGPEHKYIVMKFVGTKVKDIDAEYISSIVSESIDNYKNEGITHGFDVSTSNIGVKNGDPILIDYPYGANFEINSTKVGDFEKFIYKLRRKI
jgi:hypothetical protein